MMDPTISTNFLKIIPNILSLLTTDGHPNPLDNLKGSMRCCLEIIEPQCRDQLEGRLLVRGEEICHIQRGLDVNRVKLQFNNPFYGHRNTVLAPTASIGGIVLGRASQYQLKLQFVTIEKEQCVPASIYQFHGSSPWHPPPPTASGPHFLSDIRMKYVYPGIHIERSTLSLSIDCCWVERLFPDSLTSNPPEIFPGLDATHSSSSGMAKTGPRRSLRLANKK
jgi:hypothetical protein